MATSKARVTSASEPGIGGWLLLFTIGQAVNIAILAWAIPHTIGVLVRGGSVGYVAVSVVLFFQIARMVAFIFGLILILRLDPRTPTFYRFLLPTIATIATLEVFAFHSSQSARLVYYSLIWFFYWLKSERVRLTFAPKGTPKRR